MFIPIQYKLIAYAAILAGVFFFGFKKGSERGEVALQKALNDVDRISLELREEQLKIKEKVIVEYRDRIIRVKESEVIYRDAANNMPSKFNLTNGWVYLHDQSTSSQPLDPNKVSDDAESPVKETDALATIVSNYATCLQNAEKLISLQSWVIQSKEAVDKKNEHNN
jgi:hypothetical protein